MGADAPPTPCLPPPFAVRARSRVADLGAAFSGPPDTPPRRSPVTVPFLWEDAPGKPKAPPTVAAAPADANAGPVPEGSGRQDGAQADAKYQPRPVPLKLPPRLQQVPSFAAAADTPVSSPKTVLQGPYYGYGCAGGRPPRWARTPSAGVGLFSRTWSKPKAAPGGNKNRAADHEAGPDAPWCSPASSSSSTTSVSTCFGGDDNSHGGRGRPGDVREVSSEEDNGSPRGSVRITRFRRNRSLPSITTSNLWASIRRSVKQITLWS